VWHTRAVNGFCDDLAPYVVEVLLIARTRPTTVDVLEGNAITSSSSFDIGRVLEKDQFDQNEQ
jgi:hypothetical protein